MKSQTFQTIYLVSQANAPTVLFTPTGIVPFIIFPFLAYRIWTAPKGRRRNLSATIIVILIAAAVLLSLSVGRTDRMRTQTLVDAESKGLTKAVEGRVDDFIPMPAGAHTAESFCVKPVCFAYSDFVTTGGFNNTSSHGGPIKEGLLVRIHYLPGNGEPSDNKISRLDVASPGSEDVH